MGSLAFVFTFTGGSGLTCTGMCLFRCHAGWYLASPHNESCSACDANTYTPESSSVGFTSCLPCPRLTTAPAASIACSVPFAK
jgi:hypothetical protein